MNGIKWSGLESENWFYHDSSGIIEDASASPQTKEGYISLENDLI